MRNQYSWLQNHFVCSIIFVGIIISPAMANYQSQEGRWMQQEKLGMMPDGSSINPPMQYSESLSLYLAFQGMPMTEHDPYGLWGTSVHFSLTIKWAFIIGYKPFAALAIGAADEAVDNIKGDKDPYPLPGSKYDQGYHFNRSGTFMFDTRIVHFKEHYRRAMLACLPPEDSPEKAAKELGTSLHPLQDWVAHGDYGIKNEKDIITPHNAKSPKEYNIFSGAAWKYPDREDLDAIGGSDGRPAGSAMRYIVETTTNYPPIPGPSPITTTQIYDYAVYTSGTNRIDTTRIMTTEELKEYYWFIKSQGGCKCKMFFLDE